MNLRQPYLICGPGSNNFGSGFDLPGKIALRTEYESKMGDDTYKTYDFGFQQGLETAKKLIEKKEESIV